jgi:hypothetical protein
VRSLVATEPPATPPASSPSVITLDPVEGLSGLPGLLQTVTATVYDAAGNPLAGAPVTLSGGPPLASVIPLGTLTDAQGRITFQLRALLPLEGVWTAQAAGVQSNPVSVVWLR